MNREDLKRELRSIELAYDYNHQTDSYDITVNLEELADLVEDIVKHSEKAFLENKKPNADDFYRKESLEVAHGRDNYE